MKRSKTRLKAAITKPAFRILSKMNHRINKIKNRKKRTNQQNKVKANLLTRNHLKMRRVARKNRSQPKNKPNSKVVARTKWIKKT